MKMESLLNTLSLIHGIVELSIAPHHYGRGLHIQITFDNTQEVSITTNTGYTDANDTFEISASYKVIDTPDAILTRQSLCDIKKILAKVANLKA